MGSEYSGRVLRVDLTTGSLETQTISESSFRDFLGGNGICAYLMAREATGFDEPLNPSSPLIFATGPLTGTRAPGSGRYAVAARSPLTKVWGDSDSGGYWGEKLKAAGYDALIVVGRSPEPVYLWINDDGVSVRSAEGIWGRDTFDAQDLILAETDPSGSVLCIGPAGEKLLPIASIMTEAVWGPSWAPRT
jgi:aldehyde:ferredoxin oxidoreductase